ncbi:hypothetical protein BB560_005867, partial [Smittium megazygosporum]
ANNKKNKHHTKPSAKRVSVDSNQTVLAPDQLSQSTTPHVTVPEVAREKELNAQIGQVSSIMNQNISKVLERGENLESLQVKTDEMTESAKAFKQQAKATKRKMLLRNLFLSISIVVVVGILLVFTI